MAASSFLHQRQPFLSNPFRVRPSTTSITDYTSKSQTFSLFSRAGFLTLLSLMILLGVFFPYFNGSASFSPIGNRKMNQTKPNQTDTVSLIPDMKLAKWRDYTLAEAAKFVAKNNTVIMCAVSQPYLPFLNNWLISITRQKHQDQVLVVAEDYATLYIVNNKWPGHAVLVPPAPDAQIAHKFGSEGFFNFTSRRPRHLLHILELGFNVMYNDVDMVWLADPFPYLQGQHDVYFTDDMKAVKPLHHSSDLPPPGKKGRTYICSCMIFLRPTNGAKQVMKKWIEELEGQPWSKDAKLNDQPAFNWALNKTVGQAELYLLPQVAFPSGGLYFKNKTWVQETKGQHVIIHNNYIVGFDKKIKRFHDFGLWLVDDHALESPLGRL